MCSLRTTDQSSACSDLYDALAEWLTEDEAETGTEEFSEAEADEALSSTTACRDCCDDRTTAAEAVRLGCSGRRGMAGLRCRADGALDGAAVDTADESADTDCEVAVEDQRADGCTDDVAEADWELSTERSRLLLSP